MKLAWSSVFDPEIHGDPRLREDGGAADGSLQNVLLLSWSDREVSAKK
jgi:hypothetical protein